MNLKTNRIIHVIHHSAIIISVSFIFMIIDALFLESKYKNMLNYLFIFIFAGFIMFDTNRTILLSRLCKEGNANYIDNMTNMFLEVAKSINDNSLSSKRYGRLFALRDLLTEINTMKNNLDFTSYIKIKTLIEGSINKVKQDIKNNQKFDDPFLDKM